MKEKKNLQCVASVPVFQSQKKSIVVLYSEGMNQYNQVA